MFLASKSKGCTICEEVSKTVRAHQYSTDLTRLVEVVEKIMHKESGLI